MDEAELDSTGWALVEDDAAAQVMHQSAEIAQELDTRTHPSGDVPEHIAAEVWLSDGQDLGDDRRPASFL